ncbi:hypothetical protein L2E82_00029 [Cichorium intybus]|uniref:Uncharacterized protein n=1 Tax=Cichorium intybus TaxID=13427 RepID=A0ACB9GYB3_CICIN|nr:hypothetical protein L2E82_00029 [Cichorium intybus]
MDAEYTIIGFTLSVILFALDFVKRREVTSAIFSVENQLFAAECPIHDVCWLLEIQFGKFDSEGKRKIGIVILVYNANYVSVSVWKFRALFIVFDVGFFKALRRKIILHGKAKLGLFVNNTFAVINHEHEFSVMKAPINRWIPSRGSFQKQTFTNEVLDQSHEIVIEDGAIGHFLELNHRLAEKIHTGNLNLYSTYYEGCSNSALETTPYYKPVGLNARDNRNGDDTKEAYIQNLQARNTKL